MKTEPGKDPHRHEHEAYRGESKNHDAQNYAGAAGFGPVDRLDENGAPSERRRGDRNRNHCREAKRTTDAASNTLVTACPVKGRHRGHRDKRQGPRQLCQRRDRRKRDRVAPDLRSACVVVKEEELRTSPDDEGHDHCRGEHRRVSNHVSAKGIRRQTNLRAKRRDRRASHQRKDHQVDGR